MNMGLFDKIIDKAKKLGENITQMYKPKNEENAEVKAETKAEVTAEVKAETKAEVKEAGIDAYADEIKLIEKEYEEILETIKDNPTGDYLGQGIRIRIYKKYKEQLGEKATELITAKVVYDNLASGNTIAQAAMRFVINTLFYNLFVKIGNDDKIADGLAALTVRALHFEKYPDIATVENSEYRELLLSHSYYKKKFGPFVTEEMVDSHTCYSINGYGNEKDIPLRILGGASYGSGLACFEKLFDLDKRIYNLACNLVWKEAIREEHTNAAGEDITNSQEVADIFTILNQHYVEMFGNGRVLD